MNLKYLLSAAMLLAAAPAFAQAPAAGAAATPPAQPSPEVVAAIQTAAQAFGTCISTGVQGVAATTTPEAGAAAVQAGCSTQQQTLVHAVETMLATLPAEQQAMGHAQMEAQLGQVPTQIADGIRQSRAAAAAPAATPATPATPAPH